MWGQNWGSTIWGGGATGVPSLPLWSVLVLAVSFTLLGVWLAKGRPRTKPLVLLGALAVLVPLSARALTLPFTFTNGTVADATQVNANFEALRAAASVSVRQANIPDTQIIQPDDNYQTIRQVPLPAGRWLVEAIVYVSARCINASICGITCDLLSSPGSEFTSWGVRSHPTPETGQVIGGEIPLRITVDSPSAPTTVTLQCVSGAGDNGSWFYRTIDGNSRIIATPVDSITLVP